MQHEPLTNLAHHRQGVVTFSVGLNFSLSFSLLSPGLTYES